MPRVAALLLLTLALPAAATRLTDPTLNFSITIPDDFEAAPDVRATDPDFAHAFRRPSPAGGAHTTVVIERLPGPIPRERVTADQVPRNFTGRVLTTRWRSFDLDLYEVPETFHGFRNVTYNVQVPLKPRAIHLRVLGPLDQKDQTRALTEQLLASLDGEPSWPPGAARPAATPVQESRWRKLLPPAAAIAVVATGLAVLWRRRR